VCRRLLRNPTRRLLRNPTCRYGPFVRKSVITEARRAFSEQRGSVPCEHLLRRSPTSARPRNRHTASFCPLVSRTTKRLDGDGGEKRREITVIAAAFRCGRGAHGKPIFVSNNRLPIDQARPHRKLSDGHRVPAHAVLGAAAKVPLSSGQAGSAIISVSIRFQLSNIDGSTHIIICN
jgi:hypothetical protein